jgi:hypothetical protein
MMIKIDDVVEYNHEIQILIEFLEYQSISKVEVDNMIVLMVVEMHIHDNTALADNIYDPFLFNKLVLYKIRFE